MRACPECKDLAVIVEGSDWHQPREARCDMCGWEGDENDVDPSVGNACPKCEGATYQDNFKVNGRTIHGAMTCEECNWNEAKGQPCEGCAVYVPIELYTGNDRSDGTSEYLCPDCYGAD